LKNGLESSSEIEFKKNINENNLIQYISSIVSDYINKKCVKEIIKSLNYSVISEKNNITRVFIPDYEIKCKIITIEQKMLNCTCIDFIKNGYPCRHIFAYVIKNNIKQYEYLPFNSRWILKNTKNDTNSNNIHKNNNFKECNEKKRTEKYINF